MISQALSMWGNGAVTLPKKWREQFPTTNFMAQEVPHGLLIKPILDVEYWEKSDGSFGLHFPKGIEAGKLAELMRIAIRDIEHDEALEKKKNMKRTSPKRRRG